MDCSLPGPSVHGISQGRVVEQGTSLGYLPNPGDLLDPRIKPTSSFPVLGRDSLLLSQLGCVQLLSHVQLFKTIDCSTPRSSVLHYLLAMLCLATQSCPPLCNPTDCSPPSSSVHGDSPGKDTGVGCHALL